MPENNQTENFPLDDASIELFAEIKRQADSLNDQFRGALSLFLRQHKLEGVWRISNNGRELEQVKEQALFSGQNAGQNVS